MNRRKKELLYAWQRRVRANLSVWVAATIVAPTKEKRCAKRNREG